MRNRYVLLADVPLIALAAAGAFTLRFDLRFFEYRPEYVAYILLALAVKPAMFYAFGLYQRFWRYASVNDLLAVTVATTTASIAMAAGVAGVLAVNPTFEFSRAVLFIDWLLTTAFAGGLRMSLRVFSEAQGRAKAGRTSSERKRVLIVGAGDAGVMVVRELERNPLLGLVPVGFIDDDPVKKGKHIQGVTVFGDVRSLVKVARSQAVDEVLIAMPTAPGTVLRAVAESCRQAGLVSRTIPGVFELLGGQVSVSRLRQVDITDLLRRSAIPEPDGAGSYLTGRIVLITGGGGSIGSELCRQVAASRPASLILLGHGENSLFDAQGALRDAFPTLDLRVVVADVRDRARIATLFKRLRPKVVFHAAAHKHVPLMEDNPEEAISNNVVGTRNVVDAALAEGIERFVMISTDKAVSPTNLMGASKRVAEAIVRDAAVRHGRAFVVVRFGNVLGSRGSVVPIFKRQIENGGPVTVTHPDMRRFFMTIPEAVHLVMQAGGIGRGADLFVLNMGAPVRIVDLAKDMITLSGFKVEDIPIVFTRIRPGEKLEEALWEESAIVEATECPSVLRVRERESQPTGQIDAMIEHLVKAASTGDRLGIQAEFARWVPSYVPAPEIPWISTLP